MQKKLAFRRRRFYFHLRSKIFCFVTPCPFHRLDGSPPLHRSSEREVLAPHGISGQKTERRGERERDGQWSVAAVSLRFALCVPDERDVSHSPPRLHRRRCRCCCCCCCAWLLCVGCYTRDALSLAGRDRICSLLMAALRNDTAVRA